jgi:hypothetical protein
MPVSLLPSGSASPSAKLTSDPTHQYTQQSAALVDYGKSAVAATGNQGENAPILHIGGHLALAGDGAACVCGENQRQKGCLNRPLHRR